MYLGHFHRNMTSVKSQSDNNQETRDVSKVILNPLYSRRYPFYYS